MTHPASRALAALALVHALVSRPAAPGAREGVDGETDALIDVDPASGCRVVTGTAVRREVKLSPDEPAAMPRLNRGSLLICPGFSEDVAERGGVHGFPARLAAEGILGVRWVKWIASIEVE
jgi:hypothetical protein